MKIELVTRVQTLDEAVCLLPQSQMRLETLSCDHQIKNLAKEMTVTRHFWLRDYANQTQYALSSKMCNLYRYSILHNYIITEKSICSFILSYILLYRLLNNMKNFF